MSERIIYEDDGVKLHLLLHIHPFSSLDALQRNDVKSDTYTLIYICLGTSPNIVNGDTVNIVVLHSTSAEMPREGNLIDSFPCLVSNSGLVLALLARGGHDRGTKGSVHPSNVPVTGPILPT